MLAFGLVGLAVLLLGEKPLPGKPVALLVVVISIVLLSVTSLGELGFKIVGTLPKGLPDFHLPGLRLRDVDGVIPLAFACMLETMQAALKESGATLRLVEARAAVRDILRAQGLEERVGPIDRRVSVADAVDGLRAGA